MPIKQLPKKLPSAIWALGMVSMFMDISSELVHSLLPLFMVSALGASVTTIGFIEGIAEATALITKIFSGALSDYLGKRKLITLMGYGMAACTKPLFPLAHSLGMVVTARFIDRIGKGIRGAPRDALIADITPPELRGAAFGLRQSLDTIGAFLGPILAMVYMTLYVGDIRHVLWIAVIPAFIAVVVLAFGVKEPESTHPVDERKTLKFSELRHIGKTYWEVVALATLLSLARVSDAFLLLKAKADGVDIALVPMVMVVMNIVYALAAYPAGRLSDRMDRSSLLLLSVVFLIAANVSLALSNDVLVLAAGVGLWGLHMAFSQGLLAAMVTDNAPAHLRGTAFGVFYGVSGIAMLASGIIAGMLWDNFGPAATFAASASFASVLFSGLVIFRRKH